MVLISARDIRFINLRLSLRAVGAEHTEAFFLVSVHTIWDRHWVICHAEANSEEQEAPYGSLWQRSEIYELRMMWGPQKKRLLIYNVPYVSTGKQLYIQYVYFIIQVKLRKYFLFASAALYIMDFIYFWI